MSLRAKRWFTQNLILIAVLCCAEELLLACGSTQHTPPAAVPAQSMVQPKQTQQPLPESDLPNTRREVHDETLHGLALRDPYRWLEDGESGEVKAWLDQHDARARTLLSQLPERTALRTRLLELMYYDSLETPERHGSYLFFERRHVEREKRVVYVQADGEAAPRVLFDPNTWSEDGSTSLGGFWPSHDGQRIAYNVKENNADEAVMHVLDLSTGKETGDVIAGAKYASASWTPTGDGFYYTFLPEVGGEVTIPNRPGFAEIRYHRLGEDPRQDPVIFPKTSDPSTFVESFVSHDGRYLIVQVFHGWNASDVYYRDLTGTAKGFTTLVKGLDANFALAVHDGRFYVASNLDAPYYRIFAVDPKRPQRAHWKLIVPEDPSSTIVDMRVVGGKLALSRLRDATSELELRSLDGALERKIPLPGRGSIGTITGEADLPVAYFDFSSFTEPGTVFELSLSDASLRKWSEVKASFDRKEYVTEQVFYPSRDGTPISMFLVHRRDVVAGTDHPTMLTGYGGFNVNITPHFYPERIAWLERGGVYAIPNLRGGGEYGEAWHRAGMQLQKQTVFDDFIAAAKWLIRERWTSPKKLAISGRSNGGLLVGAAMTQAPELFAAVVCGVPLLDMLRYHLHGSGKTWIPEYGSADDPAQFKALLSYSPYHHVTRGVRYPPLLMLSADHDDRVDPMHARKFVAELAWAGGEGTQVLLRVERNAGHGGADLVRQKLEEAADSYAFALKQFEAE